MALTICKECSCNVSTLAESCPNCGAPVLIQVDSVKDSTLATETIKKATPPQLSIEKVINELLRLSMPVGFLRYQYLLAIQDSQRDFWSIQSKEGNMDASFLLAYTADDEDGSNEISRLTPLAEKGHVLALWLVGDELSTSYENPTYAKGIEMLEKATEAGLMFAQYHYGLNLDCDPDDERTYDRQSEQKKQLDADLARQKFPPAMVSHAHNLLLPKFGISERRQKRQANEAIQLLISAAKLGSSNAASELEGIYRRGRHVSINGQEMEFWDQKHKALIERNYKCPRDAYGIHDLIKTGWIDEDWYNLV